MASGSKLRREQAVGNDQVQMRPSSSDSRHAPRSTTPACIAGIAAREAPGDQVEQGARCRLRNARRRRCSRDGAATRHAFLPVGCIPSSEELAQERRSRHATQPSLSCTHNYLSGIGAMRPCIVALCRSQAPFQGNGVAVEQRRYPCAGAPA